jgi:hypothetical protein
MDGIGRKGLGGSVCWDFDGLACGFLLEECEFFAGDFHFVFGGGGAGDLVLDLAPTEAEAGFFEFEALAGDLLVELVVGDALDGEELKRGVVFGAGEAEGSAKDAGVDDVGPRKGASVEEVEEGGFGEAVVVGKLVV